MYTTYYYENLKKNKKCGANRTKRLVYTSNSKLGCQIWRESKEKNLNKSTVDKRV